MAIAKIDKWISVSTCIAMLVVIPTVCLIAMHVLEKPRIAAAEAAVASVATAIGKGESPPNVQFYASVDRVALRRALTSRWQIAGYDAIGLTFNGYEIRVRAPGDGIYHFDAAHYDGAWHVTCCGHASESEIQHHDAAKQ